MNIDPPSHGPLRARHLSADRGITIMELIVVLVIIAILAAMASATFSRREAAALAAMKSDLHNLAIAQEAYFSTAGTYSGSVEQLQFDLSPEVSLALVADQRGWSARTDHTLKPDFRCALYVGTSVPPFTPASREGRIACQPKGASGCFGG